VLFLPDHDAGGTGPHHRIDGGVQIAVLGAVMLAGGPHLEDLTLDLLPTILASRRGSLSWAGRPLLPDQQQSFG
jgi:hypothetical protein